MHVCNMVMVMVMVYCRDGVIVPLLTNAGENVCLRKCVKVAESGFGDRFERGRAWQSWAFDSPLLLAPRPVFYEKHTYW